MEQFPDLKSYKQLQMVLKYGNDAEIKWTGTIGNGITQVPNFIGSVRRLQMNEG